MSWKVSGPKRIAVLLGAVVVAAAAGWLAYQRLGGTPTTPVPSAASLAAGARLYQAHCAVCHGAELEGEPKWRQRRADGTLPAPPHDASGHTWHHPDPQLFAITKYGTAALVGGDYKSDMRGFADELSDVEIRAVLAFIRAQWPPEIQEKQAEITARAAGQAN